MASPGAQNPPVWIPFGNIKDCSQGFCSIYCPQWCYVVFPPPPPFGLSSSSDDPSASASATVSPIVIAVISILLCGLLLVAYYAVISKYCTRIDLFRHRQQGHGATLSLNEAHGPWYAPAAHEGLDEAAIKTIGQFRYRSGEGPLKEGEDCSVCLGEFRDGEGLRLLPKCSHAFHVACIDPWLRTHTSCPLCRAAVVASFVPTLVPTLLPTAPPPERLTNAPLPVAPPDATVTAGIVVEGEATDHGDPERIPPVPHSETTNRRDISLPLRGGGGGGGGGVHPIRRSVSMDASRLSRVCAADALRIDLEAAMSEEDMGSTSRGHRTGQDVGKESNRVAWTAAVPAAMKRSFSSGRFCFTGLSKARIGSSHGSVLPI